MMPAIPPEALGRRELTGCYPFRDHRTVAELDEAVTQSRLARKITRILGPAAARRARGV
jgi:hypothetical protein